MAFDCGLSRRCEQSEAPEKRMDPLAPNTEPKKPRLVDATIDPFPDGRTDIRSSQGNDEVINIVPFHISTNSDDKATRLLGYSKILLVVEGALQIIIGILQIWSNLKVYFQLACAYVSNLKLCMDYFP